jgi:hypothetical protein
MKVTGRIQLLLLIFFAVFFCFVTSASASERYKKIDAQGKELPDDAKEWAIVYDTKFDLYWEVKSADDSIHSNKDTYTFTNVEENFLAKINDERLGGHADWRLPTTDELATIRVRKKNSPEALVDLNFFPQTLPSRYMSQGWCGSRSEYQEESIKFGKEKVKGVKYVRAVRGQPLE